ncbi:hypothetical protein DICSQDRAFT_175007 [Dichomitus squalens LYAD-421 SS1]|uniref:Uncharacterized protein n=1 Tax=Dichomitus squalens (strain LYAD-421) TaxID=732165 RepID=R7SMV3_DICSQ|nr:uncharacterized protein DICSQDRAFT_175007 [Dichomitus squalens LYAD-421 SS1]EJF56327.1 hypothetical protein DICSQDRAFT_175007 [Dichomitus squalens LYAD-421 SS1]
MDLRFTCLSDEFSDDESLSKTGNDGLAGGMYGGTPYGVAASVLSLSVNLFATVIVAYKAWKSRRFLRKFMVSGDRTVQMERLFSMLVESGMAYCTLWIFVVAWQIVVYQSSISDDDHAPAFQARFGDFISGGLVPLIAIYPAIVIILVAQNRSHIEKAFGGGAVNTPEPSHWDGIRTPSATVLHIARQGGEVGEESEESSTHTADERKLESGGIA